MKVKTKKNVNGKNIVIFDTEGMTVAQLIPEMFDEGWHFTKLVAAYTNKNGEKVRKSVDPAKAPALYQKHPQLTKWSFSAANGDATINGTIDCAKNAVAITRSTGGGIRFFANLGNSYMSTDMTPAQPSVPEQQPEVVMPQRAPVSAHTSTSVPSHANKQPEHRANQPQNQIQKSQKMDVEAANTAIVARNQERREGIAPPANPDTKSSQPPFKFWLYYLLAILELPWIASTTFAIISIIETRNAQKEPDYEIAKAFLATSRTLLIGGAVSALLMIGVVIWIVGLPF